jgi:hypothetical protein
MKWMFPIRAVDRPQIQSRVTHLFDHYQVGIRSLAFSLSENPALITVVSDCDEHKAHCLSGKLETIVDVHPVDVFHLEDGPCPAMRLFRILCDAGNRLRLFEVAAALNASADECEQENDQLQGDNTPPRIRLLPFVVESMGPITAFGVAR